MKQLEFRSMGKNYDAGLARPLWTFLSVNIRSNLRKGLYK